MVAACGAGAAARRGTGPDAPRPHAQPARRGENAVPNSVFEDHAGSKVRRPAQHTYLTAYNLSLKELGQMVGSSTIGSHISYCLLVSGTPGGGEGFVRACVVGAWLVGREHGGRLR